MFSVWVLFKFFLIISSHICQLLPAVTVLVYTLTVATHYHVTMMIITWQWWLSHGYSQVNWGEPERTPHYRGLRDHVHWPTDRPTVSVPLMIRCTCLCCHAAMPLMWTDVEIATWLRTPTMGKQKAETPAQRTARLERERDQRTSSFLRFLVGVAMHPWVSRMSVFLASYFTQTPFNTFLPKHNTCTLHSGQDLRTCNAYRRA